jgi:hypothetical protein
MSLNVIDRGVEPLLRCRNHPNVAATLRCDECRRAYCRDCVVERWVTSRSSIWLCRRCAGGWQPNSSVGGAGSPLSLPVSFGRYGPLAAVVGVVLLLATLRTFHLF